MPTCNVALASGGDPKPVEIAEEGASVSDVLGRAGVQANPGDQLLIGGKPVGLDHCVRPRDLLIVSTPVESG